MAGRTVDLKFRADLSQMVAQMKTLPGMTEQEAKKMASSLERQLKKAEKASVKAAKASAAAWKRQTKATEKASKELSGTAKSLKATADAGGEANSVMSGLAGALGTVSPAAAAAVSGIGSLAGGVEAVAKGGSRFALGLGLVGIAATAGAFAFEHFTGEVEEAEEKMRQAAATSQRMAAAFGSLKTDKLRAQLDLAVATGKKHVSELTAFDAKQRASAVFSEERAGALELLVKAKSHLSRATTTQTEALQKENDTWALEGSAVMSKLERQTAAATGEVNSLTAARDRAQQIVDKLANDEGLLAYTYRRTAAARSALAKSEKKGSSGRKATKSEIDKLIEATNKLIPADAGSKVDQLTAHLERLQAASSTAADKVQAKLAPAIVATADAIKELRAEEAAAAIADLVAEVDRLASPALTEVEQMLALQKELNAEILKQGVNTAVVLAAQAALSQAITEAKEEESEAREQSAEDLAKKEEDAARKVKLAWIDAYQSIQSAALLVTDEMVARVEQAAGEEIEARENIHDQTLGFLQDEVAKRDELLAEASERDVSRELAATEARISHLATRRAAESAALAQAAEDQNQALTKAFALNKALKMADVAVNTAAAMMQAAATVPTPVLPFALAAMATLSATQMAIIASQEPPSFHLGGIVGSRPDERQITARAGEGVLTRQGVNAIGGEAGLAAANRGQGGGPMVVQMVYRHKVLDEVLSDSVRRGGPIGGAINRRSPRGRTNPHGRR